MDHSQQHGRLHQPNQIGSHQSHHRSSDHTRSRPNLSFMDRSRESTNNATMETTVDEGHQTPTRPKDNSKTGKRKDNSGPYKHQTHVCHHGTQEDDKGTHQIL